MTRKNRSLRSIGRILSAARGAERIRIVFDVTGMDPDVWEKVGFRRSLEPGEYLIPAVVGRNTEFNARGKDIPLRDREKETVYHDIWRTWEGWHHTPLSGFVHQAYRRFPRQHIDAPSENFYVMSSGGRILISSREIDLKREDEGIIILIANLFLEHFSNFEVIETRTNLSPTIKFTRLQWEILPRGIYPWDKTKTIVQKFSSALSQSKRKVVEYRNEYISKFCPCFLAVGRGGFYGYFVYGFEKLQVYLLESLYLGNATYVFGCDWEQLSKLTKSEIINGDYNHNRIIHNEKWEENLNRLLR